MRCTSYLLHAETPRRSDDTQVQNRHAALFFFCFCSFRPRDTLSFPPQRSCASRRCVIVSRKDRSGADRATGNKTAPSVVLLEALCIYIDRHRPSPSRPSHPFGKGFPLEGESTPSVPSVSRNPGYRRGGPTCLPAATRYFVTKLISRVDTSSARTGSIEGGSVLGFSKLVKDTSRYRTCSGSQSVTAITRSNLRCKIPNIPRRRR